MKPKLIGILLLAVVVLAAGGYSFYREIGRVTVLRGYLGGVTTGMFEDSAAGRNLEIPYTTKFDYCRSGHPTLDRTVQAAMN